MGTTTYHNDGTFARHAHEDPDGKRLVIASEMECDALIRQNRAMRECVTRQDTFRHVGSYPAPIVEKMMLEGSFHDEEAWKKLINDPEMRAFRVWEGRV